MPDAGDIVEDHSCCCNPVSGDIVERAYQTETDGNVVDSCMLSRQLRCSVDAEGISNFHNSDGMVSP